MPASSSSWGDIGSDLPARGCGGRETAFIRLAEEWAKAGHSILCFVPREGAEVNQIGEGEVAYRPINDAVSTLRSVPFDAVVSWEDPQIFLFPDVMETQKNAVRLIEMQVAHLMPRSDELEYDSCKFVALSLWHKRFLEAQEVKQDIVVLPNGIEAHQFLHPLPIDKRTAKFIYSSSPDRGLARLLEAWPIIEKELGRGEEAELHICYGVENWLSYAVRSHHKDGEDAVFVADCLGLLHKSKMNGLIYHGKIGQNILATIQQECVMLTYPADTVQPTETGCVTVIESCAAGAVPVITDCDCLGEEFKDVAEIIPLPYDSIKYAEKVLELWYDRKRRQELMQAGRQFAFTRSWDKIARQWVELFETGS